MIIKYLLSLSLLLSILAIGVFGFTFLNHERDHLNNNCFVNTINGEACPTKIVEFAMNNTLVSSVFNLFNLFFALIFLTLTFYLLFLLFPVGLFLKLNPDHHQQKFTRWLALLEHSPSA